MENLSIYDVLPQQISPCCGAATSDDGRCTSCKEAVRNNPETVGRSPDNKRPQRKELGDPEYVACECDEANKAIRLTPADSTRTGYKLGKDKDTGNTWRISPAKLMRLMPPGVYEPKSINVFVYKENQL